MSIISTPPPSPLSWPTWCAQAYQAYQQTVIGNPWIPHQPHIKQQRFLLHAETPEILFGGAAGGGKSDALLMAAAQYLDVPGYAALLLRCSFSDLMQPGALIPRSKEWWLGRANWSAQQRRWTFPSGATVSFGYLERDDDVYQYMSAEYQFIGVDELTQHTEFRYRYLFSRLRRLAGMQVPLRMRSGSNPGGKGHEWVKERFIIRPPPGCFFIPSLLGDNPSLDASEYVKTLEHLDPLTRQQLLEGDWDAVAGGRFRKDWFRTFFPPDGTRRETWYTVGENRRIELHRCWRFATCDPAASSKETVKKGSDPDYTVISTWAVTPELQLLWLDCRRMRKEVPDIIPELLKVWDQYAPQFIMIEGGGTQKAVVQLARRTRCIVQEYIPPPGHDKLVRAMKGIVLAESGRLWLPAGALWREVAEAELVRFTGDEKQDSHDDIVDTLSMAAHVLGGKEDVTRGTFKPYVLGGGG